MIYVPAFDRAVCIHNVTFCRLWSGCGVDMVGLTNLGLGFPQTRNEKFSHTMQTRNEKGNTQTRNEKAPHKNSSYFFSANIF